MILKWYKVDFGTTNAEVNNYYSAKDLLLLAIVMRLSRVFYYNNIII